MPGIGERYIGIRLSTDLNERVTEIAHREQNHISAVSRRLLCDALDREDAARGIVRRRPRVRSRKQTRHA